MIKETLTFKNIDGVQDSVDLYFNLSKADLMRISVTELGKKMAKVRDTQEHGGTLEPRLFIEVLDGLISASYGRRVTDEEGAHPRFVKTKSYTEEFMNSDVYDEFLTSLILNGERANKFINGLVPAELMAEVTKELNDEATRSSAQTVAQTIPASSQPQVAQQPTYNQFPNVQ